MNEYPDPESQGKLDFTYKYPYNCSYSFINTIVYSVVSPTKPEALSDVQLNEAAVAVQVWGEETVSGCIKNYLTYNTLYNNNNKPSSL